MITKRNLCIPTRVKPRETTQSDVTAPKHSRTTRRT